MDELFLPPAVKSTTSLYLATIGNVSSAGVTLIFDGQSTATAKRYKRLTSYTPTAGQRVLVAKISGTYIVLGALS